MRIKDTQSKQDTRMLTSSGIVEGGLVWKSASWQLEAGSTRHLLVPALTIIPIILTRLLLVVVVVVPCSGS